MDYFCYLCFILVMLSCLCIVAVWSPPGIGFLVCNVLLCFCHFPVWCPGSDVVLDCIDS